MKKNYNSHVLKLRLTAAFCKAMINQLQGLQTTPEGKNTAASKEIKKKS